MYDLQVMKFQQDTQLTDTQLQNEIIEVVDFVCAHLPKTLMNDCINFVELYGEAVIDILVDEEMDPKQVCQNLKLCKAPSFTGVVL